MAPIKIGDPIPNVPVKVFDGTSLQDISMGDFCATGTIVLFAVPGAFTPACSARHLPGFLEHADALKAKGVDRIACIAVNDAFVMSAWCRVNQACGKVLMLADGNAEFAQAAGLSSDASAWGMGIRSQRYAMVIKDGSVQHIFVDPPGAFEVSAAQHVLKYL
ncbi:MAG: peroxiredoxin [Rhodospirillaceae bacterium]|nr:peroxiredoxin [Rhodospirillaceae bacterium]